VPTDTVTVLTGCICCGGATVCSICSTTGTGSDSGSLPATLHVTFGNNCWFTQYIFCSGGFAPTSPYLDCVGSPPGIDGSGPDVCGYTGNNPPPYADGSGAQLVASPNRLTPVSFALEWDAAYEVRDALVGASYSASSLLATGAWVYRAFNCHGWTEFRVLIYCHENAMKVELLWFAPDNYTGTGTGTVGLGEEVRGRIVGSAAIGPNVYGSNNSCSPVYFQIGNTTAYSDNSTLWSGITPDQTPSSNIWTVGPYVQAIPYIYAIVTA